jgi:hypothetical protein
MAQMKSHRYTVVDAFERCACALRERTRNNEPSRFATSSGEPFCPADIGRIPNA